MTHARRLLPLAWAVVLTVVLLGPALAPGYVLSYDMVWVPHLALRPDFLGVGSALPRAVPSDAVVAVLDDVVPSMLLQKLVLAGSLVAAAAGTARLVPEGRGVTAARLVAVSITVWNPFVVERLVIGHWPVLLGYAVLPWVIGSARRWRRGGPFPGVLLLLVPLGSLSVSAGLATAVALVAFSATRDVRRWLVLLVVVAVANAPWFVAGLLHAGNAVTTRAAVEVFALHGEGSVPGPLAALTLGGIWNSEVVPSSRAGFQGWLTLLVVAGLVAAGLRPWARGLGRRDAAAFAACWGVGTLVPLLTWLAPATVGDVAATVPGAGVFRDGARTLALAAPALALVAATGARRAWVHLAEPAVLRAVVGAVLVVFPLALMPDAAWGVSGQLRATDLPGEYAEARGVVAREHDRAGGDVVLLPFSSYRQPPWLDGPKVLDPVGRYLTPDYVAADELIVSGVAVPGEDPRARQVAAALRLSSADARARRLADLGIGFVVRERDAAGDTPAVTGTVVHDGPLLQVTALDGVEPDRAPRGWRLAMGAAWAAYAAGLLGGAGLVLRRAVLGREGHRGVTSSRKSV